MKKVMDSQKAWVQQGRVLQHDERDRLQGRLQPSLPGCLEGLITTCGMLEPRYREGRRAARRPTCFRGDGDAATSAGDRAMTRFLFFINSLSLWVGKAFAWLILVLTLGVSYEVFVRYVLRAPTTWAFDFSYITYGALFLMAGAYTLSRNGHVRADVVYRLWKPRTQASVDLVLYIIFFLPAVLAFIYAGWNYAADVDPVPRGEHLQPRGRAGVSRSRRWSRSPACFCSCKESPRSSAALFASGSAPGRSACTTSRKPKASSSRSSEFTPPSRASSRNRVRRGPEHD